MSKVDREKTAFELQKAEVQRLLGEALDHWSKWSFENESGADLRIMVANITDALAELDNMEEPEPVILDKREVLEQQIWDGTAKVKEPTAEEPNPICTCGHSLYTHPEGSDEGCVAMDKSKGLMCECGKFIPAEEPPTKQVDLFRKDGVTYYAEVPDTEGE